MTTIKQIATDLGVSAATVSNALTGKGRVSSDMVERIKKRAQDLGYCPSLAGRALHSGQTGILGLVMPDLTNPLFPRIAQHLSLVAADRQLGILIAD
jgi:LacI family transcriptional regulator